MYIVVIYSSKWIIHVRHVLIVLDFTLLFN